MRAALLFLSPLLAVAAGCSSGSGGNTPAVVRVATGDVSTPRAAVTTNKDVIAGSLDSTILLPADLSSGAGISARTAEGGIRPVGPLTFPGLVAALGDLMTSPLSKAGATGGARRHYELAVAAPQGAPVLNITAIRFPSGPQASSFAVAAGAAHAGIKKSRHDELKIGVVGVDIIRYQIRSNPADESVDTVIGYDNGVAYLVQFGAPPGMITDAQVVAVLKAQDAKYQHLRSTLVLPPAVSVPPAPSLPPGVRPVPPVVPKP